MQFKVIFIASRGGYYRPIIGSVKLRYHFGLYYAVAITFFGLHLRPARRQPLHRCEAHARHVRLDQTPLDGVELQQRVPFRELGLVRLRDRDQARND